MQKWNLLKKTAPCILSLAVAATTFPTAVMASDLDAAVVSEAEAGDTEDFSTEETAEDTEAVAEEAIEDAADITEEAAEDVAVPEAAAARRSIGAGDRLAAEGSCDGTAGCKRLGRHCVPQGFWRQ